MKVVIIKSAGTNFFTALLQQGFRIRTSGRTSVIDLLEKYYLIEKSYIESTVSTIFVNGKPVDEPDKTILEEGDILALSGAMPGLVGAVLRSGSSLRSLRDSITYKSKKIHSSDKSIIVTIKLFNRLTREIGPVCLARGIEIQYKVLKDYIKMRNKISSYDKIIIIADNKKFTLQEFTDSGKNENDEEVVILKQAE